MSLLLKGLALLLASLPILTLGACSTPIASLSSVAATDAYSQVPVYVKAPCWMQRKWTAHNSTDATVKSGKETVYKAPCDLVKAKPAASPASPATPS